MSTRVLLNVFRHQQCDQIGRFIALWATFQSLWQQFNLPKSPTFLGNLCKGVKIFNFSSDIIFGQPLKTFGDFLLVTLDIKRIFPFGQIEEFLQKNVYNIIDHSTFFQPSKGQLQQRLGSA